MNIEAPVRSVANPVIALLNFVGECTIILGDAFRRLFLSRFEFGEAIDQMAFVGVATVPIVLLTCFFSGAVLSLYTTQFLVSYGAGTFVGATTGLAVSRELAPVLAGVMVTARCGSAMAAQIGSMAVTEQIDALRMLSVHPVTYLVIPRITATILMVPVLTLIGMFSACLGGQLVAAAGGVPLSEFLASIQQFVHPWDIVGGILKAPFFGLIIATVACQQGLGAKNGAVGVGVATRNTVVISMVLIYVANYLLAAIFFGKGS